MAAHLWQSTFFAAAAGLWTLAFRRNRANIRYWLWLSASLKFVIPFAILTSLGSYLQTQIPAAHQIATPGISYTLEQFTSPAIAQSVPLATAGPTPIYWMPIAWLCGFATIVLIRFRNWRRVRAAVGTSKPCEWSCVGQVGNLRAIGNRAIFLNQSLNIEVRSSPGLLEPGVVGILRPILLLPEGIGERLTPPELKAVIAHELCHIRRRDNLFAAIHMAVETIFWFHPLIWWIGARLVEERERACDETVLSEGNDPDIYADAILNICKLYMESPLACVSGVSGAGIRRRIEIIMSNRRTSGLSRAKKSLLAIAGAATLAVPIVIGLMIGVGNPPAAHAQAQSATARQFEVATIKRSPPYNPQTTRFGVSGGPGTNDPGIMTWSNASLVTMIATAYEVPIDRLVNAAAVPRPPFDVTARVPAGTTKQQIPAMLRKLLEDRFHLAVHAETHDGAVYLMTVAKSGSRLKPADESAPPPDDVSTMGLRMTRDMFPEPPPGEGATIGMNGNVHMAARSVSTAKLADLLSPDAGRPIVDKTGLTGVYDVKLAFVSQSKGSNAPPPPGPLPPPGGSSTPAPTHALDTTPTLFNALEQLGLKLEPGKAPVKFIVIGHVDENPTEN